MSGLLKPGAKVNVMVRRRAVSLLLVTIAVGAGQPSAFAAMESTDAGAIGMGEPPPSHRTPAVIVAPEGALTRTHTSFGNPLWAIPLHVLNETRDRPLFSPSRRPPAAVVAAPRIAPVVAAAPEPDHPSLTLVGTVVGGRQGIGIFVDQTSKAVISLRAGQNHDGWTLRAVRERDVVFDRRQREATLALPALNGKGQPLTAAVTPTPAPAAAPSSATWTDGDGQLISPPKLAKGVRRAPSPLAATWRDGDGQLITPPVRN